MRTFSGGSVEKTSSFKNFTLKLTVKVRILFLLFFLFNFYLLLLLQENKKKAEAPNCSVAWAQSVVKECALLGAGLGRN